MRYDSFYPFQHQAFRHLPPLPPNHFLPPQGTEAFSGLKNIPLSPHSPLPTNPTGKIDSFLQTADKLFSTAQSYKPYVQQIQQAVPMMKNLPALYRMYKGIKGLPDANSNNNQTKAPRRSSTSANRKESDYTTKPSRPLIFQPPFED